MPAQKRLGGSAMGTIIMNGNTIGKIIMNGIVYGGSSSPSSSTSFNTLISTDGAISLTFAVVVYKNGARAFNILLDGAYVASCESTTDTAISSVEYITVPIEMQAGNHTVTIASSDGLPFNLLRVDVKIASAYRYFRIYVTKAKRNSGYVNFVNIGEIQFLFAGEDFSREAGAVYTASSYGGGEGNNPSHAFDGSSTSVWHSDWNSASLPQWICAEYPIEHNIDTVRIICSNFGYNDWPSDFLIQVSNNGEDWITIAEVTDQPHAGQGKATEYAVTAYKIDSYYYSV